MEYEESLRSLLEPPNDDTPETFLLLDVVGSKWRNITLEDLKYACALVSARTSAV